MSEIGRIVEQLKRAQEGRAWHGPALQDALAGVSARQAAARPIPEGHTIWEIVLHVASCQEDVRGMLLGGPPAPEENDWPRASGFDEGAWEKTKGRLEETNRALRSVVAAMDENRLARVEPVEPKGGYTVYEILHGIVQHNLYHAGQIALLRKAAE